MWWILIALALAGGPAVSASPCSECLDVGAYLRYGPGSEPANRKAACAHVGAGRSRDTCFALLDSPRTNSSRLDCASAGFCKGDELAEATTFRNQLPPKFSEMVSMLQTGTTVQIKGSGLTDMNKFGIKMFIYSIKILVPLFWQMYYERGLSRSLDPNKTDMSRQSLLELESTTSTSASPGAHANENAAAEPALEPIRDGIQGVMSLLQVAMKTRTRTPWWIFLYISHWFLRWSCWLSWVVKYRLLRIRYWTSRYDDSVWFLYRPHIGGWGWDAWYRYHYGSRGGGIGGGGGEIDRGDLDMDSGFDASGEGDGSIFSPAVEAAGEEEGPPLPIPGLYGPGVEGLGPEYPKDVEMNDQVAIAKFYNHYDPADDRYYPDANHPQSEFVVPKFGEPTYIKIHEDSAANALMQLAGGEPVPQKLAAESASRASTQMLLEMQEMAGLGQNSLPEDPPASTTFDLLETRAEAALLQLKTEKDANKGSAPNPKPQSTSAEHKKHKDKFDPYSTYPDSFKLVKDDVNTKELDDDQPNENDPEVQGGLEEFRDNNKYISGYLDRDQPVEDPAVGRYTKDLDADEEGWVRDLDKEYGSLKASRPELHGLGAGTDGVFG